MSIMPDHWIRQQANDTKMIEPFLEKQTGQGVISYGLSSYGYDARLADEFKIFTNIDNAIVDPKQFDETSFVNRKNRYLRDPAQFLCPCPYGRVFPHSG